MEFNEVDEVLIDLELLIDDELPQLLNYLQIKIHCKLTEKSKIVCVASISHINESI